MSERTRGMLWLWLTGGDVARHGALGVVVGELEHVRQPARTTQRRG